LANKIEKNRNIEKNKANNADVPSNCYTSINIAGEPSISSLTNILIGRSSAEKEEQG